MTGECNGAQGAGKRVQAKSSEGKGERRVDRGLRSRSGVVHWRKSVFGVGENRKSLVYTTQKTWTCGFPQTLVFLRVWVFTQTSPFP